MEDEEQGDPATITRAEVEIWVQGEFANFAEDWLWEILTGKYPLEDARKDVLSFRETPSEPLAYDEQETN